MPFEIEKYYFKTNSLLEGLPTEEFRFIQKNLVRIEEKKGKLLFSEGSYPKGVYLLRKGKVKIYLTNKEGKEQIAYIHNKGDAFGYRPLLCESRHHESARTLEDCIFSLIPQKTFLQAVELSPHLTRSLLFLLSSEFSVWINRISVFAQQPVKARLALSLLILREKYKRGEEEGQTVVINLSREDLANYVGTSIETLVRILRSMKDEHILEARGRKIRILQPRALEAIAENF
jgi:CRP-like cAMP-binding protein